MRTKEQELEFQVLDIFNEFYKDKFKNNKSNGFIVNNEELKGMLSSEYTAKTKGKFNHDHYGEIFYSLSIKNNKRNLIYIKPLHGNGG